MNKLLLMLIGCSTLFSLVLAVKQPVYAGTMKSLQYVEILKSDLSSQNNANQISQNDQFINNDDRIGELAMSKFGCDCPSCRKAIAQMIGSRLILQ